MALTQISRSLRFNSADSAYLNRTPASAGNRKTWTWSGWVKRGTLGVTQGLFGAYSAANNTDNLWLGFSSGDLFIISRNSDELRRTTQVFRDVGSWYHIVVALDTTQATANDRVKVYLNGSQITVFTTTNNPAQNDNQGVNQAAEHRIGRRPDSTDYLSAYLTEIYFIDGQALTPSSFGFNSSDTGVWSPKQYTGTYGTNGFYLNFSDNSGTTSTTLGKDSSGNGNNWTPNNFSVTAGAGNDSMVDSPTAYGTDTGVGGSVRGNYATLNPLVATDSTLTYANGNLNVSGGGSSLGTRATISTIVVTSGKWYAEVNVGTTNNGAYAGIIKPSNLGVSRDISWNYYDNLIYPSGSGFSGTAASGDIIGIAYDADNGTVQFYKNGSTIGSQQTGATVGAQYGFYVEMGSGGQVQDWNFGQRAFAYTAPSGFKALVTTNLPTPTIGATSTTQAGKYFNPVLYTGTGSTRTVTGVGFQPDFTWIKPRSSADHHILYDAIRGVRKQLYTNLTNAEETETQGLSAFTSDGFTVNGAHTVRGQTNDNTVTYVAWNWNAGGSNATNTSGTITSTVRANTTSGFSIVTYTGTGSNATVGHGLGVAPQMVIVKTRSASGESWGTYHVGLTSAANAIYLNLTQAQESAATQWNSTAPTSSVFSVGTAARVNGSGATFVAYCFAPVAGYSAFGSYTGNANADGPFIYTGFRPEFVMIKASSSTGDWVMEDAARSPSNVSTNYLLANTTGTETTGQLIDFLSNGFKIRVAVSSAMNGSGTTYIYAAFAEFPFRYSLAR
jgi:hypothetical protein